MGKAKYKYKDAKKQVLKAIKLKGGDYIDPIRNQYLDSEGNASCLIGVALLESKVLPKKVLKKYNTEDFDNLLEKSGNSNLYSDKAVEFLYEVQIWQDAKLTWQESYDTAVGFTEDSE